MMLILGWVGHYTTLLFTDHKEVELLAQDTHSLCENYTKYLGGLHSELLEKELHLSAVLQYTE